MTATVSSLLSLLVVSCWQQSTHAFYQPRSVAFTRKVLIISKDTDGPIEYSDFGDFIPGGGDDSAPSIVLQDRVSELRQIAENKSAKLARNWERGNWKVRGFSLDPHSAKDDYQKEDTMLNLDVNEEPIRQESDTSSSTTSKPKAEAAIISKISLSAFENDNVAVVGRSDGSVCLVELGTEYWTKFESKLTATETSNSTVQIESKLVRQEEQEELLSESPFLVTHQFMAHEGSEITALLVAEREAEEEIVVVTATAQGQMSAWSVPYDDDDKNERVMPIRNLEAHSDKVVAIKRVQLAGTELMVSASIDGSVALWDLWSGDLIFKCQMEEEDGQRLEITCLDVNDDAIFLGLASGHVLAYLVPEMVQAASSGNGCPLPNGRFLAHADHVGVSALAYGGAGNLSPTSSILITGGADGVVKQWEILPRSAASSDADDTNGETTTSLEHWPRLPSQRMPKRAHVFSTGHLGGDEIEAITALASHGDDKILSASADGTVRAWSPTTGKEFYVMDGFSSSITSLCLNQDTLVTNGMNQFVCVHDFDMKDDDIEENGFDIEW